MYYDYYLLVMQVYDKNYGNATFLGLYQHLHNFHTPCTGGQTFFSAKTKIFSESVHISPYILGCTALHMIILVLPLYIYRYMRKNVKKTYLYAEDFQDFLFGYHWDPNEHIPRVFGLLTIFYKKIPNISIYI